MLCEIGSSFGFFGLWLVMTILGLFSMLILSGCLFYPYYQTPNFERWQYKSNSKFPSPLLVKKEIIQLCKGLVVATLCPAWSLMMSKWGHSYAYCGSHYQSVPTQSISDIISKELFNSSKVFPSQDISSIESTAAALPLIYQAALIFFFTDAFEYFYHMIGHSYPFFWSIHKHHHRFYNPTPFAVIADEYLDQFVRTWPMVILPLLTPINLDLLFLIFATLFYGYGVYLHWGYESRWLSAHNLIFNTAYHHYIHHALSVKNKAVYTGFFFKLWDNIFHTTHPNPCSCYECRPKRSVDDWNKTVKPDYSVLLSISWWLSTETSSLEGVSKQE